MPDNNCIFCKIAAGEFNPATVYEDEEFRVILDISPATKGHALILFKEHYSDILEVPDELLSKLAPLVKRIGRACMRALGADGFNTLINTKESAGQTVFHIHTHIIPRYNGDNAILNWEHISYEDNQMMDILEKIKAEV